MEEGQREEELLPGPRLGARVEAVLRHVVVAAVDVGLHALGRLIGQLDAVLQHQHREDLHARRTVRTAEPLEL